MDLKRKKLTEIFSINDFELRAVTIILVCVLLSIPGSLILGGKADEQPSGIERTEKILDTLSKKQATTYVGSDVSGKADPELIKGDTVIEKVTNYSGGKSTSKSEALAGKTINLNTASKAELMKLPGVGDATAEKIITYRQTHKFNSIEEIMNIKGIGQKKYEKMKAFLAI